MGLSDTDTQAFVGVLSGPRNVRDGHDLAVPSRPSGVLTVLLQGLACRYKDLPDGRRQILSFQFPGDIIDVHAFVMGRLDHTIGALTAC